MKGRSRFSAVEAIRIRHRLTELRAAPGHRQKTIRAGLRKLGFYITDWDASRRGFTAADFDRLIATGLITVVG